MLLVGVRLLRGYHYRGTQCATWRLGGMPDRVKHGGPRPRKQKQNGMKVPACDGPLLLHEVAQAKLLVQRGEETAVSSGFWQEADL